MIINIDMSMCYDTFDLRFCLLHDVIVPVFKYFPEERFALALINKGELLLRPLSYFRAYEDDGVRGNRLDGVLIHSPAAGLQINKEDGSILVIAGGRFTSSAKQDDIFAYCVSNALSADLAEEFGRFCVEIYDPATVIRRLNARACRTSQLDYAQVLSGNVEYRSIDREAGIDWALPEKLAFIKPEVFARQDEFRFAVGKRGALDVENVECKIEIGGAAVSAPRPAQTALLLRLGKLEGLANLHYL